jgi:glycosyltransferase involved in cell wall biosynthesis
MTSARVSAVMPARNAARFIEQALRSILDQTVPPASIVVVDDGSTDETATIAGSLHPSITVVRRDHAGIGAARSAGVAATTTEFVAFLDADDLWLPHKLERQLALMDDDPSLDGVFCLLDEFYDPADLPPTSVRAPRLAVAAALSSAAIVRRRLIDRLGVFSSAPVGEWVEWWSRARAQRVREKFVPEVLARRRLHASNNTHLRDDRGQTFLAIARAHRRSLRGEAELG